MLRGWRVILAGVGWAGGVMAVGCSTWETPWDYNRPPTAAKGGQVIAEEIAGKPGVVIGHFANPLRTPLAWRDVGSGISEALGRKILNEGEFAVWIDPPLAREVESAMNQPAERRARRLEEITGVHDDLRYAVTGQVTDFTHTSDVPEEARRRGLLGRREEAVVAIQLNVIDMAEGRIAASDHVYGTAKAPKGPTQELYAEVAFGSYLFWNMPLGRASEEAVKEAAKVLSDLVPVSGPEMRITRQLGPRRVRVVGGTKQSVRRGREFYVCVMDEETGEMTAVVDPDTRLALRARIEEAGRHSSTAWLLGQKPPAVNLRGAVLRRMLPATRLSTAGRSEEKGEPVLGRGGGAQPASGGGR